MNKKIMKKVLCSILFTFSIFCLFSVKGIAETTESTEKMVNMADLGKEELGKIPLYVEVPKEPKGVQFFMNGREVYETRFQMDSAVEADDKLATIEVKAPKGYTFKGWRKEEKSDLKLFAYPEFEKIEDSSTQDSKTNKKSKESTSNSNKKTNGVTEKQNKGKLLAVAGILLCGFAVYKVIEKNKN